LNYQSKYIEFKLVAKLVKFFAALLIIFKIPTKLFWWFNNYFQIQQN